MICATGLAASLALLWWNWEDLLLAGRGKRLWPLDSQSSQMSILESGSGNASVEDNGQNIAAYNPSGRDSTGPPGTELTQQALPD